MYLDIFMEDAKPVVEAICELSDKQRTKILKLMASETGIYSGYSDYFLEDELLDEPVDESLHFTHYDDLEWLDVAIALVKTYYK